MQGCLTVRPHMLQPARQQAWSNTWLDPWVVHPPHHHCLEGRWSNLPVLFPLHPNLECLTMLEDYSLPRGAHCRDPAAGGSDPGDMEHLLSHTLGSGPTHTVMYSVLGPAPYKAGAGAPGPQPGHQATYLEHQHVSIAFEKYITDLLQHI
jgi:hypothetical protein